MSEVGFEGHLSAQLLQALLDGEVPERDRDRAERHLAGCARCSAELDAWRVLAEDLDGLPAHRPAEGFAERVMAGVRPGASLVHATPHVEEALLLEFLDGALGETAAARVETHLRSCAPCAAEAEAWAVLASRIEDLGRLAPSEAFRHGVMARVELPVRKPWAVRARERVAAFVRGTERAHVDAGILQDLVDGALAPRRAASVQVHLRSCAHCADEAETWGRVVRRLTETPRLSPSRGFADRVMAAVRVVVAVPAEPLSVRALALVRRFVPRSRRAWAGIAGFAVTPATVGGLVLYTVFSHPTVTLDSLASFALWKAADLGAAAWGAVSAALLEILSLFDVSSIVAGLATAPFVVAGGVLAYTVASALALRVLYKHIYLNRPLGARYVRVSPS